MVEARALPAWASLVVTVPGLLDSWFKVACSVPRLNGTMSSFVEHPFACELVQLLTRSTLAHACVAKTDLKLGGLTTLFSLGLGHRLQHRHVGHLCQPLCLGMN